MERNTDYVSFQRTRNGEKVIIENHLYQEKYQTQNQEKPKLKIVLTKRRKLNKKEDIYIETGESALSIVHR